MDKTPSIPTENPSGVSVSFSGALVADTRRLAYWISQSAERDIIATLFRSQVLVAAAGIEATLSEYANQVVPEAYTKGFLYAGIKDKYHLLGIDYPAYIRELLEHRHALTHSEPHNERSVRMAGLDAVKASVQIANRVELAVVNIWKQDMPDCFSAATGLNWMPNADGETRGHEGVEE